MSGSSGSSGYSPFSASSGSSDFSDFSACSGQKIFTENPYHYFLKKLLPSVIIRGIKNSLNTEALEQFRAEVCELHYTKIQAAVFMFQQFNMAYRSSRPLAPKEIEIPTEELEKLEEELEEDPEPRDTRFDGLIQAAAFQFYQIFQSSDELARLKSQIKSQNQAHDYSPV